MLEKTLDSPKGLCTCCAVHLKLNVILQINYTSIKKLKNIYFIKFHKIVVCFIPTFSFGYAQ